MGEDM